MQEKYIQVLSYREGKDKNNGKPYIFNRLFDIKAKNIVSLFNNIDSVISLIPEEERYNVHYSLANCEPALTNTKELRVFSFQQVIAFDIDGVDLSKRADYIRLFFSVVKADPAKTAQICSGNGLHFVIATNKRIESVQELNVLRHKYVALCDSINEALYNEGLAGEADKLTLSDKKTLRLPNTINRKKGKEDKMSYFIQQTIDFQDYDLDKEVHLKEETKEELLVNSNVDVEAVLNGCDFLTWCRSNPNDVSEQQWRSMLTVLVKIPDIGIRLCHEYSNGYAGYDEQETEQKIAYASALTGPHKCKTIEEYFPACKKCKHYDKCVTPLQIKSSEHIRTQSTGFHTLKRGADGVLKPADPCYEDLVKFFEKTHPYKVNTREGNVYIYNGTHWEIAKKVYIEAFATKHFNPTANNSMRSEFLGLIMAKNLVDPEFFEGSTIGKMNLSNGVLNVITGELMPHSQEFGFTHVLPYEYDPSALCPSFDRMLSDVTLKDEELEQVLLEYIGYTISGMDPQWGTKALILVGEGANGKSTFIEIVRRLVGRRNYSTVPVKKFSDDNAVYEMTNKLLNVCEEESYDSLRDSTAFKNIVSGGETQVKQLYKERYTTKIMCKIIVGCNAIPPTNDQSNATYRRLLIVPFDATFSAENGNLNKNILNEINMELSGILNRVIKALVQLLKQKGFTRAKASMTALEAYRKDNDTLGSFFGDTYVADKTCKIYSQDLMRDFQEWRRDNNLRYDYDSRAIAKRLKKFYPVEHGRDSKGRYYIGIRKIGADDTF